MHWVKNVCFFFSWGRSIKHPVCMHPTSVRAHTLCKGWALSNEQPLHPYMQSWPRWCLSSLLELLVYLYFASKIPFCSCLMLLVVCLFFLALICSASKTEGNSCLVVQSSFIVYSPFVALHFSSPYSNQQFMLVFQH